MAAAAREGLAVSHDDTAGRLDALEHRFEQFADTMRHEMRRRSAALDPCLQPAGFRTLKTLARLGPVNQSVLADLLGLDKSALSRHLHQLAQLGLVERTTDAADRRAAVVEVTPAALARLRADQDEARDAFRTALGEWEPRELDELVRLLEQLWQVVQRTSAVSGSSGRRA